MATAYTHEADIDTDEDLNTELGRIGTAMTQVNEDTEQQAPANLTAAESRRLLAQIDTLKQNILDHTENRDGRTTNGRNRVSFFDDAPIGRSTQGVNSTFNAREIDREIESLRTQIPPRGSTEEEIPAPANNTNGFNRDDTIIEIVRSLQDRMDTLRDNVQVLNRERRRENNRISVNADANISYGRSMYDVRNRTSRYTNYLSLNEARKLIPEFDGSSQSRLQEFLNASTFAVNNINPAEEPMLIEAILCTKFKGKAMYDFDTRDIQNFEQLKHGLETCYSNKRSVPHLQLEFNSIKQKFNESAQAYGLRTDKLAMELYKSMIDGQNYSSEHKRILLDTIQGQALVNYEAGLRQEIKLLVKSQRFRTLHESIAGAIMEEKSNGSSERPTYNNNDNRRNTHQNTRNTRGIQCRKCNKIGHYAQDCRSTSYTRNNYANNSYANNNYANNNLANRNNLPRPDNRPRINTVDKFCNYCKKNGHIRAECWTLNGKPPQSQNASGYRRRDIPRDQVPREDRRVNNIPSNNEPIDAPSQDDNARASADHKSRINQVQDKEPACNDLELVVLPIEEAKQGQIPLLYDTGAAVSFVKLRSLKTDTPLTDATTTLTGVTGDNMQTVGKFTATIKLGEVTLKHEMHVIGDEFPIEYEGILGIDFLRTHKAECNFEERYLKIQNKLLTLRPHHTFQIPARCETIIYAVTSLNKTGIIKSEEIRPGVFIGNCFVQAHDYTCKVSIINTTEKIIDISAPYVVIEDASEEQDYKINAVQETRKDGEIGRINKLHHSLRLTHLNKEEQKTIREICEEYNDIFFLEGDRITHTKAVEHQIATRIDASPVNVRPYRLPEKHKNEVNKQIQEMLTNKIIQPSNSQWNAPLLVVPKKLDASGKPKLRVVIDFRKLNDLTIGDSFPLPNINDILDQLGNAKYFTTLDLASGYHQIPMAKNDKEKTAFSTQTGHYEFNRMPFGLKNAPATFQRLMNTVLAGLQGIKCLVYLDDIVIYGSSLEDHNKRLIEVLHRLRQNDLKLQPDKCEFLRKEVTYLGHKITENGILPDPSKLDAVTKFPTPRKEKDIQSFIGLAGYYRRFIPNFSKIARPLTKLTKKEAKFEWGPDQEQAFNILKEKLVTAPVLKYPDFEEEFIITTDASDYAIGGILSQGQVGSDNPVAYASRVLSRAEQNYNTTEKELLAIVWAVKHFRPYVYGTKFKIVTDHKPLVWLFNVTDPGSRLIRWRLKLEEYDYEIVHKAGKANTNADALSRNVPVFVTELSDTDARSMENADEAREYTEEEKKQIMYEYHDAPLGGHQGVQRTLNRIRLKHNWKGITTDIAKYINKCELCQKNKLAGKTKAPLVITDTPERPFEKCALDMVGPLPVTKNGNKYLLTFQDSLTKFSKAIPVQDQEAATVARAFVEKIVLEYGIPEKILTDQGTNFLSSIFKNTCKILKIEKIQTTAYHPQSNGALERSHRTLAEYLRHYIDGDQANWDDWIPYAIFTYNTTPHTCTKFTPFELLYGHQANLPTAILTTPRQTYTLDDYAIEMRERLRATNKLAREHIKSEKEKSKIYYDKNAKKTAYTIGDKVLLHDETVRRGRSKKLDAKWIGPYEVVKIHANENYTLKKGRREFRTHANRLKLYLEH